MELHLGVMWVWLPGDCQVLWRVRMDSDPLSWFIVLPLGEEEGMSWSLEMLCEKVGATFEIRFICGWRARGCGCGEELTLLFETMLG